MKIIDLKGKTFGNLKVIKRLKKNKFHQYKWLCKCKCGNKIEVYGNRLRYGFKKDCGCIKEKQRLADLFANERQSDLDSIKGELEKSSWI